MKIAVAYDSASETVFEHFGHTEQFKLYKTHNNVIMDAKIEDAPGSGHGVLTEFLDVIGVDVLICGGIGEGAQNAIAGAGIQLYGGVTGRADDAVNALLAGTLEYDLEPHCEHDECR